MGADRATNVYDRPVLGANKVHKHRAKDGGQLLLGYAGSGALPSVVAADLTIEATPADDDDASQLWADAIARAITEVAASARLLNDEGMLDATLLLGHRDRLWTVTHMQAIRHADGLAAVGSGEGIALGAVHAGLALGETDVSKLVHLAVTIGCVLDRYSDSGGDPQVVTL